MKVLITGGAGFIGANLARRLVERGDTVVALDDLSTGRRANLRDHERLTFIRGSILDAGALDVAAQGVDAIVHLAAKASVPDSVRDPISSHAVNVAGTIEVLEAARRAGGPHVVLASSSSVYGNDPTPKKHERISPRPLSPYAASKAATEAYAEAYHHSYDIPVLTFRFFNVFGPLQPANHVYAAVIPAFVAATVAGQTLTVHGDGKQTPRLHLHRLAHRGHRRRPGAPGDLTGSGEPRVRRQDEPARSRGRSRGDLRPGAPGAPRRDAGR